ncbi:MAG: prepilin peptidase [Planctomycetota bacterium]
MPITLTQCAAAAVAGLVLTACWFDMRTGRIPNSLTYGFAAGALTFWSLGLSVLAGLDETADGAVTKAFVSGLSASGIAMLAALIPAMIVVLLGGLGGGDMKLLAACGAWLASPMAVLDMAVVSLVAAAAMAIVIMIKKRIVKRTLAGVLGVGFLVASRVKPDLADGASAPGSATVPFAVAVAIGAGCAAAEHLLGFTLPWSHW